MVGAGSAKRIGLCFLLICVVALRTAASHEEEHEGGAGEFGEEENEKEKDHLSAYSMGLTMLGMLVLLTFLYHLTHAKRMETREISWKMFSGTISVFVGVVVYTSLNRVFIYVLEHKKINQKENQDWFIAINRFWVAFFYLLFVFFITWKAHIGKGVKKRLDMAETRITQEERCLEAVLDQHRAVSTPQVSSDGFYTTVKRHVRLMGSLEAPHREITAGRTRFKAAVCGMKCSLFWAHAIGFAGIDGWNESQQRTCTDSNHKHLSYGMMIWNSIKLFVWAVFEYYFILRVLGIAWRHLMKKLIEPRCWYVIRHKDHQTDEVLTEGRHRSDEDKVWMPYEEDDEEESDDEEPGPPKPKPQEFELEWCQVSPNWGHQFKLKYKEMRDTTPRYYSGKIKTAEQKDVPVFRKVEHFDPKPPGSWLPLCLQYEYKVGVDCYAVPEYDELVKEWNDIRKDGENDCYALMLSFIVVQTLRLIVSGKLPDKTKEDEHLFPSSEGGGHQPLEAATVYLCAIVFLALAWRLYAAMVRLRRNPMFFRPNEEGCRGKCERFFYNVLSWVHEMEYQIMRDELHGTIERILDILVTVLCMSASWGTTYATQWLLALWIGITRENYSVLDVVLAITLTFIVFSLLYLADVFIACQLFRKPHVAREESGSTMNTQLIQTAKMVSKSHKGAFRKINTSVGLLIGFTWEENFDKAVEHVSSTLSDGTESVEIIINFACMILFVLLILPIWKFQILPMSEEQGYKFGFIPRNMCVRMMMIHDDFEEAERCHEDGQNSELDQDKVERGKNHVKHMKENAHELRIMQEFLKRWQEHPMMRESDTPRRSATSPTMMHHGNHRFIRTT